MSCSGARRQGRELGLVAGPATMVYGGQVPLSRQHQRHWQAAITATVGGNVRLQAAAGSLGGLVRGAGSGNDGGHVDVRRCGALGRSGRVFVPARAALAAAPFSSSGTAQGVSGGISLATGPAGAYQEFPLLPGTEGKLQVASLLRRSSITRPVGRRRRRRLGFFFFWCRDVGGQLLFAAGAALNQGSTSKWVFANDGWCGGARCKWGVLVTSASGPRKLAMWA